MSWPSDLIASAERVTGDGRSVLYQFSVWSAERLLLKGRATVVIDATIAGIAAAGAPP